MTWQGKFSILVHFFFFFFFFFLLHNLLDSVEKNKTKIFKINKVIRIDWLYCDSILKIDYWSSIFWLADLLAEYIIKALKSAIIIHLTADYVGDFITWLGFDQRKMMVKDSQNSLGSRNWC